MKKYLTIVLSLALVLPFVSCKFSSDYMLDGELATANVWAASDWSEIEEQADALNQTATAQGAPEILDLRANGAEREVTFTVTNDAFSGFEVDAIFSRINGAKRQVLNPESVNIIEKEGGRSFVTLKTTATFDNYDVRVYMATPYGEIRKSTLSK